MNKELFEQYINSKLKESQEAFQEFSYSEPRCYEESVKQVVYLEILVDLQRGLFEDD